jgi:hypothetical protein
MCKYCDDNGEVIYHEWAGSKGISVSVVLDALCIDANTGKNDKSCIEGSIKIKYCPMCGKKLKSIDN